MKELLDRIKTFAIKNFWWLVVVMVLFEVIIVRDMSNKEIINYQQTIIEQQDKQMRTMDYYHIDIDTVSGIGTVTRIND